MKKRIFSVLLCLCMVLALFPATAFAEEPDPAAQITINGADKVCAQQEQDYKFTVTWTGDISNVKYTYDETNYYTLDQNGDEYVGTVPRTFYENQENFTLTVSGMVEGKKTISDTKTVTISSDHIYVDGICGCGAKQTYTVTYDCGGDENVVGENEEVTKNPGVDLPLKGAIFTCDGCKQIGWKDNAGNKYALGGTYSTDADVTLYPIWDEIITMEVPFTTTVKRDGNVPPGETTFTLEVLDCRGTKLEPDGVTISGTVNTTGVGDYDGTLTITGPSQWVYSMFDGYFIFVQ